MSTVQAPEVEVQTPPSPAPTEKPAAPKSIWPGLLLAVLIAAPSAWLGSTTLKLIGGPVIAIILGIIINNVVKVPASARPGIAFCSKKILQGAIIVLGGSLSLSQVCETGRSSLAVMLLSLSAALISAYIIGRLLRVTPNLISLVGVGTGICGGSAIAAVAPVIKADDDEIAFSISTVFMFNVIAVLIFPPIGHALAMNDNSFGLWSGTAINDTSSVVAASYSFSKEAGDIATVTKLARTTMIVPISLAFALLVSRRRGQGSYSLRKVFPWFVLGFLVASVVNTLGILGPHFPPLAGEAGKLMIVLALAGVGLGADLRKMVQIGPRPILMGLLVWVVVALSSLGVQSLTGQL